MKLNLKLFGFELGAMVSVRRERTEPVAGVTNRCSDGMYVTFLDYDCIPEDWLVSELESLQTEYGLGPLHVMSSGEEKWHVVGFDKLTRDEYEDLLSRSSCDRVYKKVPFTWGRRVATLRVTPKHGRTIEYVRTIAPIVKLFSREKSTAHAQLFAKLYGIAPENGEYDDSTETIMARYVI